jgi:hypothetical protein
MHSNIHPPSPRLRRGRHALCISCSSGLGPARPEALRFCLCSAALQSGRIKSLKHAGLPIASGQVPPGGTQTNPSNLSFHFNWCNMVHSGVYSHHHGPIRKNYPTKRLHPFACCPARARAGRKTKDKRQPSPSGPNRSRPSIQRGRERTFLCPRRQTLRSHRSEGAEAPQRRARPNHFRRLMIHAKDLMPHSKTDAEWRIALGHNPDRLAPDTAGKPCDRCRRDHSAFFRMRDNPEAQAYWLCERCVQKVDLFY